VFGAIYSPFYHGAAKRQASRPLCIYPSLARRERAAASYASREKAAAGYTWRISLRQVSVSIKSTAAGAAGGGIFEFLIPARRPALDILPMRRG
jgi:hypothetical protein